MNQENFPFIDKEELQKLYREGGEVFRDFIDWLEGNYSKKSPKETDVETLIEKLNISRLDAVSLAKKMEKIGCGRYITGRRGAKTRIEWNYKVQEICRIAKDDSLVSVCINEEKYNVKEPKIDILENRYVYEFPFRHDEKITVNFPEDFSKRDAERFAAFIRALPFSD